MSDPSLPSFSSCERDVVPSLRHGSVQKDHALCIRPTCSLTSPCLVFSSCLVATVRRGSVALCPHGLPGCRPMRTLLCTVEQVFS